MFSLFSSASAFLHLPLEPSRKISKSSIEIFVSKTIKYEENTGYEKRKIKGAQKVSAGNLPYPEKMLKYNNPIPGYYKNWNFSPNERLKISCSFNTRFWIAQITYKSLVPTS